MRRYLDTFFRYWYIIVLPLIVLPLFEYSQVHHVTAAGTATATLYVQRTPQGVVAPNGWNTPAQNEQADIAQWLSSPAFTLAVANGSPIYAKQLKHVADPGGAANIDLVKNISARTKGSTLLQISYTNPDPAEASQIINSLIKVISNNILRLNVLSQQQTNASAKFYDVQLRSAVDAAKKSSTQLAQYLAKHHVTADKIQSAALADPVLLILYQTSLVDQQTIATIQRKVADLATSLRALSLATAQKPFVETDAPRYAYTSNTRQKVLSLSIASLIALLLSGGFLVLMTALDKSMRHPDEIPALTGLDVLVTVPFSRRLAWRSDTSRTDASAASPGRKSFLRRTG